MKSFFIVGNNDKEGVLQAAEEIKNIILEKGGSCEASFGYIDIGKMGEKPDCIITLGGDGTLLRVARDIAGMDIPLIGVNLGHLGFLTSISREQERRGMIEKLFSGSYTIEERMMIEGCTQNQEKHIALNEVVITKIDTIKFIRCKVYVDGEFLNEYSADGIIIATPTGSTAYNLSAGGPIIEPSARMILITPICPHALSRRSIVLSEKSVIEVEMADRENANKAALFDGDVSVKMNYKDRITIRESSVKTKLVKLHGGTFLDNLRNKMNNSI